MSFVEGERGVVKEKQKARSRKKKPFPVKTVAAAGAAIAAAAGLGAGYYIQQGRQYETVFFPSTVINGVDAGGRTVEEMENLILSGVDGYVLTLVKRGGETEEITREDIGLHSEFDGSLEQYLEAQDPMDWWNHRNQKTEYQIETMILYDEELLEEKISSLSMFDKAALKEPEDAYLSGYIPGEGFQVLDGDPGNVLDKEMVSKAIEEAVKNLKTELVLEDLDAYKKPAVTKEDPALNDLADRLNKYANMVVTYNFGEKQEVLDGQTIVDWLSLDEQGQVAVSKEGVASYVKDLAANYNTAYQKKMLKTSYGDMVEITKGFYGWRINQDQETDELYDILLSGVSQSREPVYSQTAASHGENDYGDTYVEINLTAQHLFFYKDGELVVESDFVSGNERRGDSTPSGAYPLTYKQKGAVLRGATYATPVTYWMPFNGNIGMHDATWRGSFGGTIYKTNGSHGCINLPYGAAKTIFENIEKGMPVLCYHMPGSESGTSSSPRNQAPAPQPPAPAPVPEVIPETESAPQEGESQEETQSPPAETGAEQPEGGQEPAGPGQQPVGPGVTGPGQPGGSQNPAGPGESGGSQGPAGPGESGGSQNPAGPGESGGSQGPAGPGESGGSQGPAGPGASEGPGETAGGQSPAGPGEAGGNQGPADPGQSEGGQAPAGPEGPGQA